MPSQNLTDEQIAQGVELALNPDEGSPFTLGGKTFNFGFLTYDGEQALMTLLKPRILSLVQLGAAGVAGTMDAIKDLLPEAVSIILRDYGHAEATAEWVRSIRERGISQTLYQIVFRQFEVNDLGKLLSASLQADALLQALESPKEA